MQESKQWYMEKKLFHVENLMKVSLMLKNCSSSCYI